MIKLISSIELKPIGYEDAVFKKLPMIHPFGKIKTETSWDDAGELSTITLTATLLFDVEFVHEPSIVRVLWKGGFCIFGSLDTPAIFTITNEDTVVATCKHMRSIRV